MGDYRLYKIYAHYNNDGLFYIGATKKRYRQKDGHGRNSVWNEMAKNGWYYRILINNLTKEQASEIEELAVKSWFDILANMRDGGLFGTTWKHSEEAKDKLGRSVIDCDTGIIYPSVTKCADALGMTRVKLKHFLCGTVKNKTNVKYYDER